MTQRLFDTFQVANLLGVAPEAVTQWIDKGWLPSKRLSDGPVRISEQGLITFLKMRGVDIGDLMTKVAAKDGEPLPQQHKAPAQPAAKAEPTDQTPASPAASVTQVVEAILNDAIARRASHVHLELGSDGLDLRLRIDGFLHAKPNFRLRLPKTLAALVTPHIKGIAGLDAEKTQVAQSGRFGLRLNGHERQFDVATLPTLHGEKIVISPVVVDGSPLSLSQLGLGNQDVLRIREIIDGPGGLVLVIAPPRNGRTTTLRAMVAAVDSQHRSVVAITATGKPGLGGITVSQPSSAEFTRLDAVRALARQDTDAVMIDELTGRQSAQAAMDLAADGVLVLAGMRCETATDALLELLHMDLDRWALGSSLKAIVAQRTVRKICQECKEQTTDEGAGPEPIDFPVSCGRGCDKCSGIGYRGLTGLFSTLYQDRSLGRLIRHGAGISEIAKVAEDAPRTSLRQAGLDKVRAGVTSLDEIASIPQSPASPG